jgi:hypothetical protein
MANKFSAVVEMMILTFLCTMTGCTLGSRLKPQLTGPPLKVIRMQPDRAWTETGVMVQRSEQLFFTATGSVFWSGPNTSAGPDGIKGKAGWNVGAGGLIGRVDGAAKTFDVGARTEKFLSKFLRHHTYYAPPPVRMPADGPLLLGFKDFNQGANRGEFEITIRHAE